MPFCQIIQVSERGMKKRILYAFLVLVLCFCFLQTQKIGHEKFYKILKISGDNKICIDLNGDSKCSEREYFKLKHIILPDESQFGCYKKANAYLNTLIDKEITFETFHIPVLSIGYPALLRTHDSFFCKHTIVNDLEIISNLVSHAINRIIFA